MLFNLNKLIRSLCVSNCLLVTDKGVWLFCGLLEPNAGVCDSMEYLFLRSTSVTSFGVCLAVQHLRKLKYLDCVHALRASSDNLVIVPPKSYFNSFHCSVEGRLQFETVTELSPYTVGQRVTRREVNVSSYQLANLHDLSSPLRPFLLQNLNPYFSFTADVVPCFKSRFSGSLRNISLQYLLAVDVFVLTTTCPHIKSITF